LLVPLVVPINPCNDISGIRRDGTLLVSGYPYISEQRERRRVGLKGKEMSVPNTPEDLRKIMGPNEQVEMYIQQKIYHPKINVDSVVITNERIILRHPHALGLKKDYTDFNYRDIANAILDKGFVRSTIKMTLRFGGEPLSLNDLPNSEAERAYGIIRENLVGFQSGYPPGPGGMPPYQAQPQPMHPAGAPNATCPKCGASLASGQKFCGSCGAPV
jgi:Bacterial PH domain/zinc-ribbon domain